MKFRLIEGITAADLAYQAYGKNLPELFQNATTALAIIISGTKRNRLGKKITINISKDTAEELLYALLCQIILLKDSQNMLFPKITTKIKKKGRKYYLQAVLQGEKINPGNDRFLVDIKAVTKHRFSIQQKNNGYLATIVVDV